MKELTQTVEAYLAHCLDELDMPERLREAMQYSLLAGGKRLRPVLCLLCAGLGARHTSALGSRCAETAGADAWAAQARVLPFAAALEMIHTYSLIHDDLPAMDDDDQRRGRPSNHKAFDEATAILAGDALVTDAFSFMAEAGLRGGIDARRVLQAMDVVACAAGGRGMVGGQVLDMLYTGEAARRGDASQLGKLRRMQALKTGALFRAACLSGGILGGADETVLAALTVYADALGLEFQIVDDILDETQDTATLGKPAGSDAEQGKLTWPALTSLEESRARAEAEAQRAYAALAGFDGAEAETLRELALKLAHRIR